VKVITLGCLIASLAAGIFSTVSCQADVIGYGFYVDSLYSINFTKATATYIGFTPQMIGAIAVSKEGNLFAINVSGQLLSLDTTTGAATVIGDTHVRGIDGLSFNGDTLVTTDNLVNASFYSIDTTTAAATYISTTNPGYGMCRSLTFQDTNVAFFSSDRPGHGPGYGSLIKTDLLTGASTVIGALESLSPIYGISFAPDGSLYGLSENGSLFSINSSNGKMKSLGNIGGKPWFDITISSVTTAVPEPGAYGVLAGMFVPGAAFLIRRRKVRVNSRP